jgi:hypothetical protein
MAETKVYSIQINGVTQAVNSINDLEQGVKTLEEQLKGEQIGTDAFKRLQNEVKKAKSQLKDFELQVEGLDKEQRATALVDSFNGLTGAVGAVSSAFLAFGVESEAIGEAEKKLLGVIGVVSGLRDASNGLIAVQKLMGNSSIKLGDSLKSAFKGGVSGAKALKGALIATGIGALIVAVGLLIENWEAFTKVLGFGASEAEKNLAIAEKQTAQAESQLEITNSSTELLKQQGMTDKEILALKISQTQQVITALEAQLVAQEEIKKQQIASAQRNKDILVGIIRFLNAPLEILTRTIDAIGSALGKDFGLTKGLLKSIDSVANLAFNPEDVAKKGDETIKETEKKLLQLKNQKAGFENQQKAADKTASDKAKADGEKAAAEAKAARDKALATELAAIKANEEAKRKLRETNAKEGLDLLNVQLANEQARIAEAQAAELAQEDLTEKAKLAIQEKYQNESLIAQATYDKELATLNAETAAKELEDAKVALDARRALKDAEIAALPEGYDKERAVISEQFARQIEDATGNAELIKALEQQQANALVDITKKETEEKNALRQQQTNDAINLVSQGLDAILALNEAFGGDSEAEQKKAFEIAKKAQLAQAVISTIQGAQNAFATASASPLTAIFPAYPFIQAGLATAFGLASIKKIASSTFQSTSAPSGGGTPSSGGTGGGSTPNGSSSASLGAPQLGGSSSTQNTNETTQSNTPVVKTYVLAGEVSSAQDAEAKINQRRTL